jgi:ABC-2 type transport system permease protein
MAAYWTMVRRELSSHFLSWTGYVIVAAVVFLIGFGFASMLKGLNGEATPIPITQLFFETIYFWLILLLVSPVITMRSFALEKSSGTYETLMTTPVNETQVVLAKFTGALLFYLVIWLPLLACLLIVRAYINDPSTLDPGAVGATFFGIFLLGALYMAVGLFASAITRSQIIAAMISLALGLSLFMLSFLRAAFSTQTGWVAQLVAYVGLMEHMQDFAQGIVDTRPLVFYLTATVLFLFLTWKVAESRRWK